MPSHEDDMVTASGGAWSASTILRFHGISAEPGQARHALGTQPTAAELVRYLRDQGLKAKHAQVDMRSLDTAALPAIVSLQNARYSILAKVSNDRVLLTEPSSERPTIKLRSEFEADWSGEIIFATRRARLGDLGRRFDLSWFVGAIRKYRWILGEVLVASLFLQIFGLISPLFFQVVVDKVLVHRGTSTLDVLVFGVVVIGIFEALLGASVPTSSRTRPIVSTSSSARGCSGTWSRCPCRISRQGGSATPSHAYANWRTSANS